MIVLLLRQMGFGSIVAAQSLSRLFLPILGYFFSFPKNLLVKGPLLPVYARCISSTGPTSCSTAARCTSVHWGDRPAPRGFPLQESRVPFRRTVAVPTIRRASGPPYRLSPLQAKTASTR